MTTCPCGKPAGTRKGGVPRTYCSRECQIKYQNSWGYGVNLHKIKK